jgi:hypothetical protein
MREALTVGWQSNNIPDALDSLWKKLLTAVSW